jgi:hypothetical protein
MPAITAASKFASNQLATVYGDCAGDLVVNEFFIDLTAAQLVNGNFFDLGILPAYHTVVDMVLIPDDLDANASPTITLDVGLLSGTPGDTTSNRTIGAEFFSGDVGARTGALARMSLASGFKVTPTEADRSIGVKISAAVATAAAGRIRLLATMAPADHKVTF